MMLRKSKFFGYCSADDLDEFSFFAKNFKAEVEREVLNLSLEFVKGLDVDEIQHKIENYTFFEIEDTYLKNKLLKLLNELPQIKKIMFLKGVHFYAVKRLKITSKGFLIKLVQ